MRKLLALIILSLLVAACDCGEGNIYDDPTVFVSFEENQSYWNYSFPYDSVVCPTALKPIDTNGYLPLNVKYNETKFFLYLNGVIKDSLIFNYDTKLVYDYNNPCTDTYTVKVQNLKVKSSFDTSNITSYYGTSWKLELY